MQTIMMPIQYTLLLCGLSGLVCTVLTIIFKPLYDRKAEQVEQLTANECQVVAEYFQKRANELRTPGK